MSVTFILICLSSILSLGESIPLSVCFEPFNWEDCGRRPHHVLYYYKPGSRCEVAIWRGCPTRNMFKDEYECINTCIYMERAGPEDYHKFENEYDNYQMPDDYGDFNETAETDMTTVANDNATTVEGGSDATGDSNTETGADGSAATNAGGDVTTQAGATGGGDGGGGGAATTAAGGAATGGADAAPAETTEAPPPE